LYEGLRTMAWDPVFETACAKHELDYKSVKDQSIYVKFKIVGTNDYFVIWTTTPWTIPLNLAIMANPTVSYARVAVRGEHWIVAEKLVTSVMSAAGFDEGDYTIAETMLGSELVGKRYEHPLTSLTFPSAERAHTVLASEKYVTDEDGTGLVHCAPGCGPEDYEVGVENGLPAFNPVGTDGSFPAPFAGLKARTDDKEFVRIIEESGALVAKRNYVHDYPHSERSGAPVIYRATKQWFFKISDLRDELVAANENITWQPRGGQTAFKNWLANLRDNSITKQRYWGTAVPIWRNEETNEVLVIGSIEELEKLSGQTVTDIHKPFIDTITIPSTKHKGTVLTRIPDVLDVWVDAGSAAWNAFDYPRRTDLIESHYPSDFIIEGIDQYRGWFNLLMVGGFLAFGKASFTNVYVHGYINDSQGRKMSKSLANYITPKEVLPQYGVDALRLSLISAAQPGEDISYGVELVEQSYKNLLVLWSTAQYLVDLCATHDLTPVLITDAAACGEEERYLLSRMTTATVRATQALERYDISELPREAQALWLELSRTYIQLVREKAQGDEKQDVANLLYTVLRRTLTLLAPVCPFITEALWQDLNDLTHERGSVHEALWPVAEESCIDEDLEAAFASLQQLLTAGLAAREKLKQGVRWPLRTLAVRTRKPLPEYDALLKRQLNVRVIEWNPSFTNNGTVEPVFGTLAKTYGKETQRVAKLITEHQPTPPATIEGFLIEEQHVKIKTAPVPGYAESTFTEGTVYVEEAVTPELLEEGYARELTRAVQALRKDLGLSKRDRIELHIGGAHSVSAHHLEELCKKANAALVSTHVGDQRHEHIRDRTYTISARKTI